MKSINLDHDLNKLLQENSDWAWEQAQKEREAVGMKDLQADEEMENE